jgi:mannitol/fructose-specific phosphotransferase system IIA component (Ntr-type)
MEIESFFGKDHVITLKGTEKQVVIKEMVAKLESLGKIDHIDRFYAQVVHRESLENTGIGHGFAIPHARTDSVEDFLCIFGIAPEGIEYQSFDKEPVRYLLLSIFPTSMSTKYLYLVSMMARIFAAPEKREALEEGRTPAKVFALLKKESKAYFAQISKKEPAVIDKMMDDLTGVPSSNLDLLIRLDRLYQILDTGENAEAMSVKIAELRRLIDNRSLTYYERMRKKLQNPFAIIDKTSCSGCHMEIPPVYMAQIKESKDIPVCNHCGRFLIIV